MLRRDIRLRREYLTRKSQEGKAREEYEKKMKIRAGSPQEEEALLKMVELLTVWTELKTEVSEMIECLLMMHRREDAVLLQVRFDSL